MTNAECAEVDCVLEELALGEVAEPTRTRLLGHVAACAHCRDRLDATLGLADTLLALAPSHEPPPGFEARVLQRLGTAHEHRGRPAKRWSSVAAAVVFVAMLGGYALGHRNAAGATRATSSGAIVRFDGAQFGTVRLVEADRSYVLVTIDHPLGSVSAVSCELELADGTRVTVGSWNYDDVKAGVWAVGVDEPLLAAVTMRVVDERGAVVATAMLK